MKNFYTKIGLVMLVVVFIASGVVSAQQDENTAGIGNDGNGVIYTTGGQLESGSNDFGELDSGGGDVGELDSGPDNNKDFIGLKNPLRKDINSVGALVQVAVEIFSYVVIIFAVLAFIWVGLQYILARGNSEKMKEMSKWLGYIVIGVAVVIGARVIISIVINTLSSTGVVDERVIKSAEDALRGN